MDNPKTHSAHANGHDKKQDIRKDNLSVDFSKGILGIKSAFRRKICSLISDISGKDIVESMIKPTPAINLGDFAFPCFILDKDAKTAAENLKARIDSMIADGSVDFLEKVVVAGPYLNFFIGKTSYALKVIESIKSHSDKQYLSKKDKRVVIEYSQANTHKAFHVGHLRGTSIGESLARIMRFSGYDVTQVNYEGDTGIHVAKWIWCYRKFHSHENPDESDREKWIASIYVDAVKRLAEGTPEEDKAGLEEVSRINQHIENRDDQEIISLWQKTRKWSLDAFETIYADLHAHFDNYFFESDMEGPARAIVAELRTDGIAKIDDDASIVDLGDLGIWVLLKKDGTTLYSAKDLALAKIKMDLYHPDKSVYIVGAAQSLHFNQLFETLKRMKFPHSDNLYHLAFAEVRLPTGKMSSRTGQNILYSDLKQDVWDYSFGETRKRHPEWPDEKVRKTSKAIMISALKFEMIGKDSNKIIIFDSQKSCEFEGETGPYMLYVCARICSVLRKCGEDIDFDEIKSGRFSSSFFSSNQHSQHGHGFMLSDQEYSLISLLDDFFSAVEEASDKQKVFLLVKYLLTVSKAFNEFYHACRINDEKDESLRRFRISLAKASYYVLVKGLDLLAMDIVEEM